MTKFCKCGTKSRHSIQRAKCFLFPTGHETSKQLPERRKHGGGGASSWELKHDQTQTDVEVHYRWPNGTTCWIVMSSDIISGRQEVILEALGALHQAPIKSGLLAWTGVNEEEKMKLCIKKKVGWRVRWLHVIQGKIRGVSDSMNKSRTQALGLRLLWVWDAETRETLSLRHLGSADGYLPSNYTEPPPPYVALRVGKRGEYSRPLLCCCKKTKCFKHRMNSWSSSWEPICLTHVCVSVWKEMVQCLEYLTVFSL